MRKSKGRKLSEEWKQKIRIGLLNSGRIYGLRSEETKKKISKKLKKNPDLITLRKNWELLRNKTGNKHHRWKGNKVHYSTIHRWIYRYYGKANKCENINCEVLGKRFEWALIHEKKYKKDVDNYIQLCSRCHRKYDRSKNYKLNLNNMATNGALRTVLSDLEGKKASSSVITTALSDVNTQAKKSDPKKKKK